MKRIRRLTLSLAVCSPCLAALCAGPARARESAQAGRLDTAQVIHRPKLQDVPDNPPAQTSAHNNGHNNKRNGDGPNY